MAGKSQSALTGAQLLSLSLLPEPHNEPPNLRSCCPTPGGTEVQGGEQVHKGTKSQGRQSFEIPKPTQEHPCKTSIKADLFVTGAFNFVTNPPVWVVTVLRQDRR